MTPSTPSTPGDEPGPPELSGSLEDFTLAELFELLTATRKTGVLTFSEPVEATLWVTDGAISYGTSPGTPGPRELMDRQGVATAQQYDGALAATDGDQALYETLTDLFDVDGDRIAAIAREQIFTTAFEIVVVGADSFEFRSGRSDPLGSAVTMDHGDVLSEAERRRDEWRRIAELIPSTGIVVALSPSLPDERAGITITADEWQILAQLDGHRSVADVIEILGQSAFEVCGILYDLLDAATIEVVGRISDDVDNQ